MMSGPYPLAIAVGLSIGAHVAAALYVESVSNMSGSEDRPRFASAPIALASLSDAFGQAPAVPLAATNPAYVSDDSAAPQVAASYQTLPVPHFTAASTVSAASLLATAGAALDHTISSVNVTAFQPLSDLSSAVAATDSSSYLPPAIPAGNPWLTSDHITPPINVNSIDVSDHSESSARSQPNSSISPSAASSVTAMHSYPTESPAVHSAQPLQSENSHAGVEDAMIQYFRAIHGALSEALRYPDHARSLRHQGQATIDITVARDGSLLRSSLHESSGYASLDTASLDAARRARFAPAPQDAKGTELRFLVPLQFRLDFGAGY